MPGLLPWAPLTGEDIRALDEAIDAIHSTQKPMELHQDQPLSCSWRRKGYQGVMFWPPSVMFSGSGYLRTYDDWYRDPERTVETLGLTIVTAYVRQVAISKFVARGEQEPKGNH